MPYALADKVLRSAHEQPHAQPPKYQKQTGYVLHVTARGVTPRSGACSAFLTVRRDSGRRCSTPTLCTDE
uniref:Uncharacterized protein n=1 Tax=Trichogramma kaykai TaxID=54128 RepID=A0ABD2WXX1_9HYME